MMKLKTRDITVYVACGRPGDYKYGEHTADVLIEAYGCTVEEAFGNAAIATADVTYYSERVAPIEERRVEVEHDDLEGLLFSWISEVLYLFDGEKFAISRDIGIAIRGEGPYRLTASVRGEKYDVNRHGFKGLIVKAMTYNMMEIRHDGYWAVRFVVDI
jgi:SHS2 domain-containing protein